ncbi:MAG: methionine synthase [Nocardiaceae bacterium]|nr:methionine synthase [Nocardiaceae bacterium]
MTLTTGIGSWPGRDPREAASIVVGELTIPHVVELPARGLGADMIGRASAILTDLHFDISARSYRLAVRPGAVAKVARDRLREDLDALEEAWETSRCLAPVVKVQAAGPWTLAASVELANGHRAMTDPGAVRDIADSLADGLREHAAEVAKRLNTKVIVQIDEPELPAVLAGTLRAASALNIVRAVPEPEALKVLESVIEGVGLPTTIHCCADHAPLGLFRKSSAAAVALDVSKLKTADLDHLGEILDAGKNLWLGLVPTAAEPQFNFKSAAEPATRLFDRLGFPKTMLDDRVVVTPACGLGGSSIEWARRALRVCTDVAKSFSETEEA